MPKRGIRKRAAARSLPAAQSNGNDGRPRFEVYIIDSGWKTPASRVLRESMDLFLKYLNRHEIYMLSEDQSEEFLQGHPQLLGRDPIVAVLDRKAIDNGSSRGIGVRLLLGGVHDTDRVQDLLKMLLRIVNTRQLAEDLPGSIRKYVHREGVSGAIDVIVSTAAHESETSH